MSININKYSSANSVQNQSSINSIPKSHENNLFYFGYKYLTVDPDEFKKSPIKYSDPISSDTNMTKFLPSDIIYEELSTKHQIKDLLVNSNKKEYISTSNLPTANNSFYTYKSGNDEDKINFIDEYQGLAENLMIINNCQTSNLNNKDNQSEDSKISEIILSSFKNSLNNSNNNNFNNNNKKLDDLKLKFKTEKCKFWDLDYTCIYGDNCAFAHGIKDLRKKSDTIKLYKSQKCKYFFENGFCSYGNRCQFSHNIKRYNLTGFNMFRKSSDITYSKKIQLISNNTDINSFNLKCNVLDNLSCRPRLLVFKQFSQLNDTNNKNNSLINDITEFRNNKSIRYDFSIKTNKVNLNIFI